MGAMTAALTAVESALTAAGITSVIKEFSNATPPTVAHVVLSVESSTLERADADTFDGRLTVTGDWFSPGLEADGQTEFLAAMDAYDTIITALTSTLDRGCMSVDPGGNIVKLEESADLAHWYAGTFTVEFMRKEASI
jgi:hypothetical protein